MTTFLIVYCVACYIGVIVYSINEHIQYPVCTSASESLFVCIFAPIIVTGGIIFFVGIGLFAGPALLFKYVAEGIFGKPPKRTPAYWTRTTDKWQD